MTFPYIKQSMYFTSTIKKWSSWISFKFSDRNFSSCSGIFLMKLFNWLSKRTSFEVICWKWAEKENVWVSGRKKERNGDGEKKVKNARWKNDVGKGTFFNDMPSTHSLTRLARHTTKRFCPSSYLLAFLWFTLPAFPTWTVVKGILGDY